jgi:ribosome recycling factor
MTPINQVGTVNVPEPRMVTINVWDKSLVGKVEKAIRESGLGINPQLNGTIIMLPIPELNEERRRELTKVAGNMPNMPASRCATCAATGWTRSRRPRPRA